MNQRQCGLALRMADDESPKAKLPTLDDLAEAGKQVAPEDILEEEQAQPARFQPKIDKSGAGFNQFDPVLFVTSNISRRFGLVGGLGVVALLASTEGKDIVKALLAEGPKPGTGEIFETENGVEYEDVLIGPPGENKEPAPGKLVGMTVVVRVADQSFKKDIVLKFGSRPFQSLACEVRE